jgi:hypothetical protein
MTRALHNTKHGIKRRLDAALEVGLHIVGIAPDGTILTSNTPPDDPDRRQAETVTLTAASTIGTTAP